MELVLNGKRFETATVSTVLELLKKLDIQPGRVAVEVNMAIVKKNDYETFTLHHGDTVEIVNFIGGG